MYCAQVSSIYRSNCAKNNTKIKIITPGARVHVLFHFLTHTLERKRKEEGGERAGLWQDIDFRYEEEKEEEKNKKSDDARR